MTKTSKKPHAEPAAEPDHDLEAQARQLDQWVHTQLAHLSPGLSPISLSLAFMDWAMHLGQSPGQQMLLMKDFLENANRNLLSPAPETDARFSDETWSQYPFSAIKTLFKTQADVLQKATQVEGMSDHHRQMVEFFTRQWLDALSPSNWPLTNPEVLHKGMASKGESWLKGWQNYLKDLEDTLSNAAPRPEAVLKPLPYEVGKDVAITQGKVIYSNHLIELIHYTPATDKVFAEPVLIVPSCIMKYYILDLSPHNSMVKYLVSQGHSVFMISWRNPDESDRNLGFEDYLRMGVMEAMTATGKASGSDRIHAIGYCLGGTFLSIVAAIHDHDHRNDKPKRGKAAPKTANLTPDDLPELASVCLLAAQTDFSEPGALGIFIDDDQLKTLREDMAEKGYMSGKSMAGAFQFLNARELVWSQKTRRYLLGEDEISMDMMSWNADHTRLPERMHNEYLTEFFLHDALAEGHYKFEGRGIALMDIKAPLFVVGTLRDHVSPWKSVYKIHLFTDTDTTFVLVAGGHNAGIISEPGHPRRSFQMDHAAKGHAWMDPDEWVAKAPVHEGSWWPAMHDYLKHHSSKMVAVSSLPKTKSLGVAPGRYILMRYAD